MAQKNQNQDDVDEDVEEEEGWTWWQWTLVVVGIVFWLIILAVVIRYLYKRWDYRRQAPGREAHSESERKKWVPVPSVDPETTAAATAEPWEKKTTAMAY